LENVHLTNQGKTGITNSAFAIALEKLI
jgi:hypothetical protein